MSGCGTQESAWLPAVKEVAGSLEGPPAGNGIEQLQNLLSLGFSDEPCLLKRDLVLVGRLVQECRVTTPSQETAFGAYVDSEVRMWILARGKSPAYVKEILVFIKEAFKAQPRDPAGYVEACFRMVTRGKSC